jgi:hypothetical protein
MNVSALSQNLAVVNTEARLGVQQRSEMQNTFSYRNCLIHIESFQLTESSGWIPRYTLMRQGMSDWNAALSCRDRLDKVFWSKDEADEFALEDAMQRIDQN